MSRSRSGFSHGRRRVGRLEGRTIRGAIAIAACASLAILGLPQAGSADVVVQVNLHPVVIPSTADGVPVGTDATADVLSVETALNTVLALVNFLF